MPSLHRAPEMEIELTLSRSAAEWADIEIAIYEVMRESAKRYPVCSFTVQRRNPINARDWEFAISLYVARIVAQPIIEKLRDEIFRILKRRFSKLRKKRRKRSR